MSYAFKYVSERTSEEGEKKKTLRKEREKKQPRFKPKLMNQKAEQGN